jgi:rubredoxin
VRSPRSRDGAHVIGIDCQPPSEIDIEWSCPDCSATFHKAKVGPLIPRWTHGRVFEVQV